MRCWRRGAAAGLGALGLVLAGCTEAARTIQVGEGPGGGAELFNAITEARNEAGSHGVEITLETGSERIEADGAASFEDGSADVRMAVSAPAIGDMEMLLVDGTMYVEAEVLELPADTRWVSLDPDSDNAITDRFGGPLDMRSSVDLQAYLNEYADEIIVEEGGEDTIDGVDVTEYVVTIDLRQVDALPYLPEGVSVDDLPVDEVSYSLWVDGRALLRRITSGSGSGGAETHFFDYGEPAGIEAPDPDEVTDSSVVLAELSGG